MALSAFVLLAGGYASTRYDVVRRAVGLRPLLAPGALPQQGPHPLAKEYVYAGGRLIATEEPAPVATPAGPPPTNLVATTTSASGVHLEWVAAAGAIGYVVERRGAPGTQPIETPTGSALPEFDDSVPPGDNSYLYRVKAVYAGARRDRAAGYVFTSTDGSYLTFV